MKCHEVDYRILGDAMQVVEIDLDPGEAVIAEAGMMNYMDAGIGFETRLGDGSKAEQGLFGKLFGAGKRALTGESLFMTHFKNKADRRQQVAFAAPFPGTVIPVDMAAEGGLIYCQKDAFLAAALGTRVGIAFSRRLGSGFFGGEGFILQKLEGDGLAFIQAGGTVIRKELRGETLKVDTGCLVGFTADIDYDIELVRGLKSMLFGGEGACLTTLKGTGSVWLQSLPFSRLADRIIASAPALSGDRQGE